MKRFARSIRAIAAAFALLAVLVAAVPLAAFSDVAGPPYTWTLSSSLTDPYVNTGPATNGVVQLYLWAVPGSGEGWTRTSLWFSTDQGIPFLAASPLNGISIPETYYFAVEGCPVQPIPVADVLVLDIPGEICITPNPLTGTNCTWNCSEPPVAWQNSTIGYSNQGTPCAFETWDPCGTVGVESDTWGRIKATYR